MPQDGQDARRGPSGTRWRLSNTARNGSGLGPRVQGGSRDQLQALAQPLERDATNHLPPRVGLLIFVEDLHVPFAFQALKR